MASPFSTTTLSKRSASARAAIGVRFDQLDVVVALQQLRQMAADVPAAGDDDSAVRLLLPAEGLGHRVHALARGDEKHLVAGLEARLALRENRLVAAVQRGHAQRQPRQNLRQFAQRAPDQTPAPARDGAYQQQAPVAELGHLECARVINQQIDVARDNLLRADQHVNRNGLLAEQFVAFRKVSRRPDQRDLGRDVEDRVRDAARDDVDLVVLGQRDQHVGVVGVGALQHVRVRTAPDQRAHVETMANVVQARRVLVYQRDLVVLLGQARRQRSTEMARAEDDDSHRGPPGVR